MSFALRSFILVSAISASWLVLIEPMMFLPGSFEPDLIFIAFLMRKLAGGLLVTKVKLRSA